MGGRMRLGTFGRIALAVSFVFQTGILSHPALGNSVVYDITPLFTDPSPSIPLLGRQSLMIDKRMTSGTKILFEDKFPQANWAHPAIIRFVDENGKVIEERKTQLPPKNLENAPVVSGLPFPVPTRAEFQLSDFKGTRKVKEPSRF